MEGFIADIKTSYANGGTGTQCTTSPSKHHSPAHLTDMRRYPLTLRGPTSRIRDARYPVGRTNVARGLATKTIVTRA